MLKQAKDKNSGQRNVRAKRSESYCLLLWQRSNELLRGQCNQRSVQLEAERELLCGRGWSNKSG